MNYPKIIQGGMGVAVSAWPLARAVAQRGQLGVVSGTAIDAVLTRRLQSGDEGGHLAEALAHFPVKEVASRIWDRYYVPGGKSSTAPFKSKPVPTITPPNSLTELIVVANFVEVWLAKQGHDGLVGINLLEKIQLPTLPSLFGAMLAGVDYVLMGAGIPRAIPGILEQLSEGRSTSMQIDVTGGPQATMHFDPSPYQAGHLHRPKFLAIVSSASLAQILARKASPPADGFVVEGHTAGGHNAPPRGTVQLDERGEPIYGDRDMPDFEKFRELGQPFWIAGSFGTREKLEDALRVGAQGIQVGTGFAFCDESGIKPSIKAEVIRRSVHGEVSVRTDIHASPTGLPFKVLELTGSLSQSEVAQSRTRVCDLGYLREAYYTPNGDVGYRCPGEPVEDFVKKGGDRDATTARMCVCNGLMSTVGFGQVRKGIAEPALVTAGDDVENIVRYLKPGRESYTASDVIDAILG